jgi:hypothetical protein
MTEANRSKLGRRLANQARVRANTFRRVLGTAEIGARP